ncbi:MAG: beta-phosphoglucomutase family hydrolase [Prevotellaceae bacterium]|jgi:beta-phosphoglucomutase family hydrolase|nr:beta-phosphoglucomutase family hydrolase [Prevotellaceae bacterium]
MNYGVIFDMDGTLVDNMKYHMMAYHVFLKKYGIDMTDEKFLGESNGKTNNDIMRWLFGADISQDRVDELSNEKEALYRDLYAPHMMLAPGLKPIMEQLHAEGVPMAVGSSAINENINFVLDGLEIRKYFKAIVDSSQVAKGKPDPEVFLRCAKGMGVEPQNCVVFEDAWIGIDAAHSAGMKVITITTVLTREQLKKGDVIVDSFTEVNVGTIKSLLKK